MSKFKVKEPVNSEKKELISKYTVSDFYLNNG
jgi:hypothetical protein